MAEIIVGCRQSKWTYHHVVVFVLTFIGYSLFHATRKAFSNVKTTLSAEWRPQNTSNLQMFDNNKMWNSRHFFEDEPSANVFLGVLDTVFMSAYAVGLYLSGFIGDRYNMRYVLSAGMWLSAIMMFMFGTVSEWLNVYDKAYYITFWFLCGLFQSSGWPTVIAVMGNWFGKSSRGLLFGLWGSCTSVGNIVGAYIVAEVLPYGYQYAFLVPASLLFCGGIVIFFTLVPSPKDIGMPEPVEEEPSPVSPVNEEEAEPLLCDPDSSIQADNSESEEAIGFVKAFLLPGVAAYSLAYACLKMVNYSFFFWLPFYLSSKFKWPETEADRISTWYDVGGIIGAVVSGYISDRMSRRSPTVVVMLLISPVTLYIYSQSSSDKTINGLLMGVVGIFVNGAANIISTAISADLGRQKALRGNNKALATVSGIVDGTGSVGAAVGQIIIPHISNSIGWEPVFYLFMALMLMTNVCILPIFVHDVKFYIGKFRRRHLPGKPDRPPGDGEAAKAFVDAGDVLSDDEVHDPTL